VRSVGGLAIQYFWYDGGKVSMPTSRQGGEVKSIQTSADHVCVLLASGGCTGWNKLEFLSGKRVSILFSTAEPSWQSGGHEFDPRQLHQQNKQLTRFLKIHFSPSNANICRLFADFVSRIDVCDSPNHRHSLLRIARYSGTWPSLQVNGLDESHSPVTAPLLAQQP